jgi:hypothetical protein
VLDLGPYLDLDSSSFHVYDYVNGAVSVTRRPATIHNRVLIENLGNLEDHTVFGTRVGNNDTAACNVLHLAQPDGLPAELVDYGWC